MEIFMPTILGATTAFGWARTTVAGIRSTGTPALCWATRLDVKPA
jgi:hypothetical protein